MGNEKRIRIMQRSMKLGHCVCDPKEPCPCDIFKDEGVCLCAGEKRKTKDASKVKLTELVHNAGCASKIPAGDLDRFLNRLIYPKDANVISGISEGDDAGIYRINDSTTLVQTVDVFTPCVDDPFEFGKICAVNCLSDIYAMGGVPRTALSILAFPSDTMDPEVMFLMMKGAMEILAEAECTLIGGHSIKDNEIKLGFSITGTIDGSRVVALSDAKVGDKLVLTKSLGVGVLNFAKQIGKINETGLNEAKLSMMTLNRSASEAMNKSGVSAATDITGFGLFGHLIRMIRKAGVTASIEARSLPVFQGVLDLLKEDVIPGAIERNKEFVGSDITIGDDVPEEYALLGFNAETSGGLLISVPMDKHEKLLLELKLRGIVPVTIGEIVNESCGEIKLI
ncbi:MAG: selenide, water dikinase SelD [Candidatus Omnitrophica bacterium]|nr:selenide, water dikinase SelD [Candidatus Omnitrophota bacterium]